MVEASGGKEDGGEFLLILDSVTAAEAQEQLHRTHRVTQVGSPRVVVVAVSPEETPPSPSTPGVVTVSSGSLPPDIFEELDEQEALFVAAWASRMTGPEKQRRGEGLPWDAPGFEPPDAPTGTPPGN
jgi:hypothetical protein